MSGGRKTRRPVSDEERKLWKAVSRQFKPLSRVAVDEDGVPEAPVAVVPAAAVGKAKAPSARVSRPAVAPPSNATPPLGDFESRRAKRLAAGRLPIEARIDLHGMRQEEARTALMDFLRHAFDHGLRHVKVITGKGAAQTDQATKPFSLFDDHRRGVLRDQVPWWLQDGTARTYVVSFTEAGRGHGGSGALYIQMRKKPGRPRV